MRDLEADPRQERWKYLADTMPTEPIPLERTGPNSDQLMVGAITDWKTFDGKPILFPKDEDPEHVKLVRSVLPFELAHLEGFFFKKEANTLPPHRLGHDVVLELERPPPSSGPPRYRTPIQFLPLEKETVDLLLAINFIEPGMDPTPPLYCLCLSHTRPTDAFVLTTAGETVINCASSLCQH